MSLASLIFHTGSVEPVHLVKRHRRHGCNEKENAEDAIDHVGGGDN